MSTSKHDKDVKDNSIKSTNVDTTKIINQTFDDAKNKARKAIDETHRELPRYMQTVTNNQEQTVNVARDMIDNYLESQRDITNSFWISPKRITDTRTVSSISDRTIAAIRIWNGTTLASTETMRISTEYMRDNAIETSRVAVNDAKMLEEATHISHGTSESKSS